MVNHIRSSQDLAFFFFFWQLKNFLNFSFFLNSGGFR